MTFSSPGFAHAARSVGRLHGWLVQSALPLWIDRGFDAQGGGFHERLDFQANPIPGVPRRLTVQARQIFVYSRAIMLGWSSERGRIGTAFEAMIARYHKAGGAPGFAFSVDDRGQVVDGGRDLYAHAFFLLAAAAYYQLTGDSQVIALTDETLGFIDTAMAMPSGGYFDCASNPPARLRQNPHMHVFEALLALYEVTGAPAYLARADAIFGLLETRFYQADSGIIPEYFDAGWMPVDGDRAIWEPGHHMEWSWLLAEYETLSGKATGRIADALIGRAYRDGVLPPALIVDEVRGDGLILKRSCRAWPLTEAAKAQAVRLESGDPQAAERLAAVVDQLCDRHLSGVVPGLWSDHFSEDGQLLPDYVPASTLYHIAMAGFVTEGVLGHVAPQPATN